MEQGPPSPFEEYVLGAAVPAGFVVHQYHILPEHWVREAGNFLEGLALVWYNSLLNTSGNHSWQEFADGMHHRFGCTHSALSIARMWDNLKQEG